MTHAAFVPVLPNRDALVRARSGDEAAFAEIVREHQAMVFSIAQHFLRDRRLAEELAQDVFLELFRSLERLESAAHVVFWLRRVTSHRCIDLHRRQIRRKEVDIGVVPELTARSASRDCLREARLARLVAALPDAARAIVILRYQEDMDPMEIATLLGMRVNTVKSHLRRSLALLRARIADEGIQP